MFAEQTKELENGLKSNLIKLKSKVEERNWIMLEKLNITLEQVDLEELPQFTKKLQEAFSIAVKEKFGTNEPVPSEKEIQESFHSEGTEIYHIGLNGNRVGGAVLTIDKKTQHNFLDLFFISPEHHSRDLGFAAWKAIEVKYPDTTVWETITPYFEERNIHFYINKCGFHIVEFFNERHIDPNMSRPQNQSGELVPGTDTYFRFEKVMK
ncbi:GNAT family N-acetyltransferase [Extibacter muris]|nr:GNAT family N-acetyltransferase [Extibacter muris]